MTGAIWYRERQWPLSAVFCFLLLVIAFDAPIDGVAIHAGSEDKIDGLLVFASMWGPAAAAFATCLVYRRGISVLGFDWPSRAYAIAGYALPVTYAVLAYSVLWITGLAPSQFHAFDSASTQELVLPWGAGLYKAFIVASAGVIRASSAALGEEIGWRGFLIPALAERLSFPVLVLVSGVIWAGWHVPAILWEGYNSGGMPLPSVLCFSVMIIATGGIAAWLRLRSKSVWPAALFHGCHNAIIQRLLDPLTSSQGHATAYSSEFGLGLAVSSSLLFAVLLWRWGGVDIRARVGNVQ